MPSMRTLVTALFVLPLLVSGPLHADSQPYLVKDIDDVPRPADANLSFFVSLGDVVVFTGEEPGRCTGLYRTDGTAAGTFRLTEGCPGPAIFTWSEEKLYFQRSNELWVTDGTVAGTLKLSPALTLVRESRRRLIHRGILYFFAWRSDVITFELWRSDGTPEGTRLVADFSANPPHVQLPGEIVEFGEGIAFQAFAEGRGPSLWVSDGTPQGTRFVKDTAPGTGPETAPALLNSVNGRIVFASPSSRRGFELWTSDGTTQGTVPLVDLVPGPKSPSFFDSRIVNGRLFFVADAGDGQELWVTDGTSPGTRKLTSFALREAFGWPEGGGRFASRLSATGLGDRFFFRADDGKHGQELWVTDGTVKGTKLVRELCPGACRGLASHWIFQDRLYFAGSNAAGRTELWSLGSGDAAPQLVKATCSGGCSFGSATGLGARQVFSVHRESGSALWVTNGTTRGTSRLAVFDGFVSVPFGGALGDKAVFVGWDPKQGRELWSTDGTPAGTGLVVDLVPGDLSASFPSWFHPFGTDRLLFRVHRRSTLLDELWVSDGTAPGTRLIASPRISIGAVAQAGRSFFFNLGSELWGTDGTSAGTRRLTPPGANVGFSSTSAIVAAGSKVFFAAFAPGQVGTELWTSDGTPTGTRMVIQLNHDPDDFAAEPRPVAAVGDRVLFVARDRDFPVIKLWLTDGTAAGTKLVRDVEPYGSSLLTPHGQSLYFLVWNQGVIDLWRTDGTPAGTGQVLENAEGKLYSTGTRLLQAQWSPTDGPRLFVIDEVSKSRTLIGRVKVDSPICAVTRWRDRLAFCESSGSLADEFLMTTDGTEAGTRPVLDRDGNKITNVLFIVASPNRLFFVRVDEARTPIFSLWESDGTQLGTRPVDLGPDLELAGQEIQVVGSRLYFSGHHPDTGTELWAIDLQ